MILKAIGMGYALLVVMAVVLGVVLLLAQLLNFI